MSIKKAPRAICASLGGRFGTCLFDTTVALTYSQAQALLKQIPAPESTGIVYCLL